MVYIRDCWRVARQSSTRKQISKLRAATLSLRRAAAAARCVGASAGLPRHYADGGQHCHHGWHPWCHSAAQASPTVRGKSSCSQTKASIAASAHRWSRPAAPVAKTQTIRGAAGLENSSVHGDKGRATVCARCTCTIDSGSGSITTAAERVGARLLHPPCWSVFRSRPVWTRLLPQR